MSHEYTDENGGEWPYECRGDDGHTGDCPDQGIPILRSGTAGEPYPLPRPIKRHRKVDLLGCLVYLVIIIAGVYLIGQGVRAIL